MGTRAGKDGEGRGKTGKVFAWLAVVAGGALAIAARSPSSPAFPRLSPSDIHSEYVKFVSGRDTITAYLSYPERRDPAPAVIVIHEIFGMSDFIGQTTEQLAKDGFVAIAPDLLSRRGGTPASPDSARKLIATLNPDTVTMDLNAAAAFLKASATRPTTPICGRSWCATVPLPSRRTWRASAREGSASTPRTTRASTRDYPMPRQR